MEENTIINESPSSSHSHSSITLELGDLISVRAPSNSEMHERVFYVYYIDAHKMKLFDMSSKTTTSMTHDGGGLEDESIIGIDLLYRNLQQGFAKQNGLLPGVWVNAHFGGDMPSVISGEITNLEEDMIEITTYPGYRVIYIDFGFAGLPEDIALDKIVVADRPAALKNLSLRDLSKDDGTTREEVEEATAEYDEGNGEFILHIPESVANAKPESINDLIEERMEPGDKEVQIDDFEEGEVLGEMSMMMEVLESERRYGLDAQLSDMMGKLVSRIPLDERTPQALEKIRVIVSRYKDLRETCSEFDENRNVTGAKQTDYLHKPSIDHIINADMNLGWIIPVVYEPRELVNHIYLNNRAGMVVTDAYSPQDPLEFTQIGMAKPELQYIVKPPKDFGGKLDDFEYISDNIHAYENHRFSTEQNSYDAKMNLMNSITGHTKVKPVPQRPHIFSSEVKLPMNVMVDSTESNTLEAAISNKMPMAIFHSRDKRRFFTKTYLPGETRLFPQISGKNRKKTYVRAPVTPSETAIVRSFVTLPDAFFTYQYVNSPSASIDLKSRLARHPPFLYRALKQMSRVKKIEVTDLEAEIEYYDYENKKESIPLLKRTTHYTLSPNAIIPSMSKQDVAHNMLNAVIPRTRTLMKWMEPKLSNVYSYIDVVKMLEPFGIYEWNITFRQYMEARYFIKQQITRIHERLSQNTKEYVDYKNMKVDSRLINRISNMVKYDDFANNIIKSAYRLDNVDDDDEKANKHFIRDMFPSEYIARMENMDGADIFMKLIQNMMIKLISPNEIMNRLENADIDTSDKSSIKNGKCANMFIAKKYESESALQKDNGATDPIYYDKEYDDTPYHILQSYKKERAHFKEPKEFSEYLEDKLIRSHDCPAELAPGLAATMILGKKEVSEGEYAILYVVPKLVGSDSEINVMSEREKRDIVSESIARAKISYYKRVKNQWVSDASVDETSFIDNNTLFCNLAADCTKQRSTGACLPNVSASVQMRLAKREKIMEEFDKRATRTAEQMATELNADIMQRFGTVNRFAIVRETKEHRQNSYSFELGKYVSISNEQATTSPYAAIFQKILGLPDFVKTQMGIIAIVDRFTTEPTESQDPHWYYCKDTGVKLVPVSIYRLANGFRRGTYMRTLDEVCREFGTLSDDGDCIEDMYTGFFLKKIEYSTDEGFGDDGFQIRTRSVVTDDEANVASMVHSALQTKTNAKGASKRRVFADKTMQLAYNVYALLGKSVGLSEESVSEKEIEEFVLRTTLECMNDSKIVFLTEVEYVAKMRKRQNKGEKEDAVNAAPTFAPFETYRNQTLVILVASALHISIQTLIPSFKTKTHFSGCVQSFEGYPLDPNSDNAIGIKYMACILDKLKRSSSQPWKSVESIGVDSMVKRMRMVIGEYLVKRSDIDALYTAKREFVTMHVNEDVPSEVSLGRWTHFLPPIVPVDLAKPPAGITADFEKELFSSMKKGDTSQHASIRLMEGKLIQFAYGAFEAIQKVVENKRAILNTAGGRAFLENTCCNEPGAIERPLAYFLAENPELEIMLKKAARIALILRRVTNMNMAPMFFAPESSRITYPPLPENIIEDTIFQAYITYCKFNSDEPIPRYLESVCAEKPKYDRTLSLREKIHYMRKHGKDYGLEQFYHLMRAVNAKNQIKLKARRFEYESTYSIGGLTDMLSYFDMDKPSPVVERNLVGLIDKAVKVFDGKTVHIETPTEEKRLKSYLLRVNREMTTKIESFITSNSVVYTSTEINDVRAMLREPGKWNYTTGMKDIGQQIMNSMSRIGKIYPSMVLYLRYVTSKGGSDTPSTLNTILYSNWGLSLRHQDSLKNYFTQYYFEYILSNVDDSDKDYRKVIGQVMRDVRDIFLFMEQIPVFRPVNVFDDQTQSQVPAYYLFDDQTTRMLYEYGWISLIYQFLVVVMDPEYNQVRPTHRERAEKDSYDIFGDDDEDEENKEASNGYGGHRLAVSEVQIEQMDNMDLRHKIAKMLMNFLLAEVKSKAIFDMNYSTVIEKTGRLKYSDKKRITDYMAKMTTDERRIEMNLKKNKLGRWDVGLKSSLFKYDKANWNKETMALMEDDGADNLVYSVPAEAGMDAEDLDRVDAEDADRESYEEANDISGLGEDYMDGAHYDEDVDREDEW